MCGVFGYIGREVSAKVLVDGLQELEYRGYDSWGVAVVGTDALWVHKQVGPVEPSVRDWPSFSLGLGHTRWATHGGVTHANAHPHLNESDDLAVVHNGIIENANQLRRELQQRGHTFASQTDSEVAVHLYEEARESMAPAAALREVFSKIQGLSAVVFLDSRANVLVAGRRGSPLLIGRGQSGSAVVSDVVALKDFQEFAVLPESGGVVLTQKAALPFSLDGVAKVDLEWQPIQFRGETQELQFAHHMLQEIFEQPAVIRRLAETPAEHWQSVAEEIRQAHRVVLTGCGSAFFAATLGAQMFQKAGKECQAVLASELADTLMFLQKGDVLICFSQSGETIDLLEPARQAKKQGVRILSFVNVPHSTLARVSDRVVHLQAGTERAVASTKAFVAKLTALWLVSQALANELIDDGEMQKNASELEVWLESDGWREELNQLLDDARLDKADSMFVLGKGLLSTVAREIALKIQEIAYQHAQSFPLAEFKHGPLALVRDGFPALILQEGTNDLAEVSSAAAELGARGAVILTLGQDTTRAKLSFTVPGTTPFLRFIGGVLAGQLLAYELSVRRGINPDRPRNLAKSVTVK